MPRIAESVLRVFNGLRRHFRVVPLSPPSNRALWPRSVAPLLMGVFSNALRARRPYEARYGLWVFLKNNIMRQPAWQEIVDFLNRASGLGPALSPPSARHLRGAGASRGGRPDHETLEPARLCENGERGGCGAARRSDVLAQRRGRGRAFAAHELRRALNRASSQTHRQLR